jgi:MFS superfamily sulfate permease-like transporter
MTGRFTRVRPDLLAGVTAAAVVIPKAMAYATIARLPVQVGLYTACVPMAIYALLGTSRPLSVSTTTTLAILSAAAFGDVTFGTRGATLQANASLTVLVGVILIGASLLRLGFVANFISEPVLVGFKAGIAIVILADQIPKILGVHIARGSFLQNLASTAHAVPETSVITLSIAMVTIALLVILERRFRQFPRRSSWPRAGSARRGFFTWNRAGSRSWGGFHKGCLRWRCPIGRWPRSIGRTRWALRS